MPEGHASLFQTLLSHLNLKIDKHILKTLLTHVHCHELLSYYLRNDKSLEYLALGRFKHIKDSEQLDHLKDDYAIGTLFFEKGLHFIVPDYLILREHDDIKALCFNKNASEITAYFNKSLNNDNSKVSSNIENVMPDYTHWNKTILETTSLLKEDNNLEKVVLGKKVILKSSHERNYLLDFIKLTHLMPSSHHHYLSLNKESAFICLSPETLYRRDQQSVVIDTLAGTRARGNNLEDDKRLERELLSDLKDRGEHTIVSDVINGQLKGFGNVSTEKTSVLKLSNVQHLHTPIKLKLSTTIKPLELAKTLHPTPALGGHPRAWALNYIEKTEPFKRNIFAAPIGLISQDKEELIVGIRSANCHKDKIEIFGGCGIVAKSDPKLEWSEINAKIGFLQDYFLGEET